VISVVAVTNRVEFIPRIIENFERQTLKEKELILIVQGAVAEHALCVPPEVSLGECLNHGLERACYPFVAKMDDDDYYGPDYLAEAYTALMETGADLVGKSSFYIYFEGSREVCLYNPGFERRWITSGAGGPNQYRTTYFMSGATLVFRKDIGISFPHLNKGEDSSFQRLCYENGAKMYSLSIEHYAYIRYDGSGHHHSDVSDNQLRRRSKLIGRAESVEGFFQKIKLD
jgi:glycosyltransferase involved in cell wall biosynthesis